MTPCRGAEAQSPLCAGPFPALHDPRLERRLHKGAQKSNNSLSVLPNSPVIFGFLQPLILFVKSPKKLGLHPWAACLERLRELSQLGSLDASQIHPEAVGYRWICPKVGHHLFQNPFWLSLRMAQGFLSRFSEGSTLQGELRNVGRSQQAGAESVPKGKQKQLHKTQSCDSKKTLVERGK